MIKIYIKIKEINQLIQKNQSSTLLSKENDFDYFFLTIQSLYKKIVEIFLIKLYVSNFISKIG